MSTQVRARPRRSAPDQGQLDLFEDALVAEPASVDAPSVAPAPQVIKIEKARPTKRNAALSASAPDEPRVVGGHRPENLAEVLELFVTPEPTNCERDVATALRMIGKVLAKGLDELPTSPASLMPLLNNANPATIGMKPQRWGKVRTHLRHALRTAGYEVMPGRDVGDLSSAWAALAGQLDKRASAGLSRFLRYCSRRGVEPQAVSRSTFEEFEHALKSESLQSKPEVIYATTVKLWNEVAKAIDGWPLCLAERRPDARRYALPAFCLSGSAPPGRRGLRVTCGQRRPVLG